MCNFIKGGRCEKRPFYLKRLKRVGEGGGANLFTQKKNFSIWNIYVENIWSKPQFWRCTNSATVVQSHFQKEKMFQKPTIPDKSQICLLIQKENLRNGGIVKSVENILPTALSWKGTNFATVGRSHFKRTILWNIVSYASSYHDTLRRSSCIACRQKVSRRCVKACDTSNHWNGYKRICTVYTKWAFLQCVWACDSLDFRPQHWNNCTDHTWMVSLLNGCAYMCL